MRPAVRRSRSGSAKSAASTSARFSTPAVAPSSTAAFTSPESMAA
jgi:hypothetical protein